jgi:hypothetical protein
MALTQVSTDGVKNDAITKTKIPANQIEASELADNAVDTNAIANNAVTAGKLASGVQTTINNNADNRVITGSGTANTLEGESNLKFDGSRLGINDPNFANYNADCDDIIIQGSGNTGITINSGGTGNSFTGNIAFAEGNGTGGSADAFRGAISYKHNDDYMTFHTDYNERMRIDSSGRMLLGTTTEGEGFADDLTIANSSNTGLTIRSGTSNYGSLFFSDGTSGSDEYRGYVQYGHTSNFLNFGTNATERMRIDSSGNVGINTTSPAHKLDLDNGSARFNRGNSAGEILTLRGLNANQFRFDTDGLKFGSDTAAANALDDYEEGTFSPTFGASNGSSTTTYTTQQGAYTKIGNTVFFNIYIVLNSISTNTHSVIVIGALPFTNTSNRVSIHSIRSSGFQGSGDDSRPFAGTVEANNTKIELVKAANGGTSDFTTSNSQGGTRVYIAGQYPVS